MSRVEKIRRASRVSVLELQQNKTRVSKSRSTWMPKPNHVCVKVEHEAKAYLCFNYNKIRQDVEVKVDMDAET